LLSFNNSYFLIRLHDAQAFFPANLSRQAKHLLVSSSVESSFLKGGPVQRLHKLTTLKKNIPCQLGILTNLTEWIPAREQDSVSVKLEYRVLQGAPVKSLVEKMEKLQLEFVVSAIRPDMAIAVTVSKVVGYLLSFFLEEGKQVELFPLTMDLNLADLKIGYHAVLGSSTEETYPSTLEMKHEQLTGPHGHDLSRYSYAVIEVGMMKRRQEEVWRRTSWGELLSIYKDETLHTTIRDNNDLQQAFQKWLRDIRLIRALAEKDDSFLKREVMEVIAEAQLEVQQKLRLPHSPEADLETQEEEPYPPEWQQVLGVNTPQELRRIVRDYQDAVELSERLLQEYQQTAD
jgi:hypothetical protein